MEQSGGVPGKGHLKSGAITTELFYRRDFKMNSRSTPRAPPEGSGEFFDGNGFPLDLRDLQYFPGGIECDQVAFPDHGIEDVDWTFP